MYELIIGTGWTLAAGLIGYSISQARHRVTIRRLQRDQYYLRRWLERQRQATVEADLAYEIERMRK